MEFVGQSECVFKIWMELPNCSWERLYIQSVNKSDCFLILLQQKLYHIMWFWSSWQKWENSLYWRPIIMKVSPKIKELTSFLSQVGDPTLGWVPALGLNLFFCQNRAAWLISSLLHGKHNLLIQLFYEAGFSEMGLESSCKTKQSKALIQLCILKIEFY